MKSEDVFDGLKLAGQISVTLAVFAAWFVLGIALVLAQGGGA